MTRLELLRWFCFGLLLTTAVAFAALNAKWRSLAKHSTSSEPRPTLVPMLSTICATLGAVAAPSLWAMVAPFLIFCVDPGSLHYVLKHRARLHKKHRLRDPH
jgi:hypothetical protein